MTNSQLLLTPKNVEILGGYVESLVTKWELTRSLAGMKGNLLPFCDNIKLRSIICREQNNGSWRSASIHPVRSEDFAAQSSQRPARF